MTPEDFRNIATGIQALLIASAVVIGGVWALYRFITLHEISRAKNELAAKERELKRISALNITLQTIVTNSIGDIGKCIVIDVSAENPGNHPELIGPNGINLEILPVVKNKDGSLQYGDAIDCILGDNQLISTAIEPYVREHFSFAAAVSPGLYRIIFECQVFSNIIDIKESHKAVSDNIDGHIVWSAEKFVEVPIEKT